MNWEHMQNDVFCFIDVDIQIRSEIASSTRRSCDMLEPRFSRSGPPVRRSRGECFAPWPIFVKFRRGNRLHLDFLLRHPLSNLYKDFVTLTTCGEPSTWLPHGQLVKQNENSHGTRICRVLDFWNFRPWTWDLLQILCNPTSFRRAFSSSNCFL